ncbi:MAG: hypothetical protein M0R75_02720 [Dehalococcoidia bacterium]|nr:hypothetical protein [Dehalococcoidia bacterium]
MLGGVTEWMRVAHTASSSNLPVAPHWLTPLREDVLRPLEPGGSVGRVASRISGHRRGYGRSSGGIRYLRGSSPTDTR